MQTEYSDLVIIGGIDDKMLQNLMLELQKDCYQRHIPLRLFISSPGGSMPLALTMSRLLISLFDHIETYNIATVDSAAVCLYLAGSQRYCFPSSRFFLHPASMEVRHPMNEEQMLENLNLIRSDTESMQTFYRERTGIKTSKLCRWFKAPTVLSAPDAIKHGIATELCDDIPDFSPHYINNTK